MSTSQNSTPNTRINARAGAPAQEARLDGKLAARAGIRQPGIEDAEHEALLQAEATPEAALPEGAEQLASLEGAAVGVGASEAAAGTAVAAEAGAAAGAAGAGAAAAATVSPAVIGAGVLGVVAVGAAAGGGGGGGGSSASQPIADGSQQDTTQPGTTTDSDASADKPAEDKADDAKANGDSTSDAETPATEIQYGVAKAGGDPDKPTVATEGETSLAASKAAFTAALTEAGVSDPAKQFIRIDRILASENGDHESRIVRYGADEGTKKASVTDPNEATAYEVVSVEGGISYEDAKAAAAKLGGTLVEIDDAKEAAWLLNEFRHQLEDGKAWIGTNKEAEGTPNTAARSENGETIEYSTTAADGKLNAFIVEFNNYKHPLTLDGKPVAEGTVLSAAEFDKLVWNATNNKGGEIKFSVVDNDQATAPGQVGGSLSITESASVVRPVITEGTKPAEGNSDTPPADNGGSDSNAGGAQNPPADNGPGGSGGNGGQDTNNTTLAVYPDGDAQSTSVTLDKTDAALDASLFAGTDVSKQPAFITITAVTLTGAAALEDGQTRPAALVLNRGAGEAGGERNVPYDNSNFTLNPTLFDKLTWDASFSDGGTITFIQSDEKGNPLPGAKPQTITITETPPPAPYKPEAASAEVGNNAASTAIDKANFGGSVKDDANPAFIKIEKIEVKADELADKRTVRTEGEAKTAYQVVEVAEGITRAEAEKQAEAMGGKLLVVNDAAELTWLTENFISKLGTTEDAQNVANGAWIGTGEFGDASGKEGIINHENEQDGGIKFFDQDGEEAKLNAFIVEFENYAQSPLLVAGEAVKEGQIIASDKLDSITWNSQFNNGGSIQFVQVVSDASDAANADGAASKTVNITEAKPRQQQQQENYEPADSTAEVANNARSSIAASNFDGSAKDSTNPAFVKITGIEVNADDNVGDLLRFEDAKSSYLVVNAGSDGITFADAQKAAEAMGGSLLKLDNTAEYEWLKTQVAKLDLNGENLGSGVTAGAWMASADDSITDAEGKEGVIAGGSDKDELTFVDLGEDSSKLSAYVVEFSNIIDPAKALFLAGETDAQDSAVEIGAVLSNAQLATLEWNSIFNSGGSLTFVEVVSGEKEAAPVEGAKDKTVNITEKAAVTDAGGQSVEAVSVPVAKSLDLDFDQMPPL